jgi:hypothetical protein
MTYPITIKSVFLDLICTSLTLVVAGFLSITICIGITGGREDGLWRAMFVIPLLVSFAVCFYRRRFSLWVTVAQSVLLATLVSGVVNLIFKQLDKLPMSREYDVMYVYLWLIPVYYVITKFILDKMLEVVFKF